MLSDLRQIPALAAVLTVAASAILTAAAMTGIDAATGNDRQPARVATVTRLAPPPPARTTAPAPAAAVRADSGRAKAGKQRPQRSPSVEKLIGQMLVVQMVGPQPSAALLKRVRHGQVGGIIVMGDGATDRLPAAVHRLQAAALQGDNPPLLVATDQEGGNVQRFSSLPPDVGAPAMGEQSTTTVQAEGARTGVALSRKGVNINLAPVVDVPTSGASFINREGRAFSSDAATVGRKASAFAVGLQQAGVAATVKHFPGLGSATRNTDVAAQTLRTSPAEIKAFKQVIDSGVKLVMVSSAVYEDVDPGAPFVLSPKGPKMLRRAGYRGLIITDSLSSAALRRHDAFVGAAAAGADLLLHVGDEASGQTAYRRLVQAAGSGRLNRAGLKTSYERIRTFKRGLPH